MREGKELRGAFTGSIIIRNFRISAETELIITQKV